VAALESDHCTTVSTVKSVPYICHLSTTGGACDVQETFGKSFTVTNIASQLNLSSLCSTSTLLVGGKYSMQCIGM